jgi:uncharacterized repeat protein (TIGR03803 family)
MFGTNSNDGILPMAGLTRTADGTLYGTTGGGGVSSAGTIYRLNPDGSGYAVLRSFIRGMIGGVADGMNPQCDLLQASDGALYGTASSGGYEYGAIFRVTTNGASYLLPWAFSLTNGISPLAGLIQASDGKLYGTTSAGASTNGGGVFRVNTDGSGFQLLHSFTGAPNSLLK